MQVAPVGRQPNGAIVFGRADGLANGRASSPTLRVQTLPVHTRGITFVSPVAGAPPGPPVGPPGPQRLQARSPTARSPSPVPPQGWVRAVSPHAFRPPEAYPNMGPPAISVPLIFPDEGQGRRLPDGRPEVPHHGRSAVDPVAMSPRTMARSQERPMACATWASNFPAKVVHKMDSVAEEECESVQTDCGAVSLAPTSEADFRTSIAKHHMLQAQATSCQVLLNQRRHFRLRHLSA